MFSGMSSSSSKSEDGTDEGLNKRATKVRSSPQINSVCFQGKISLKRCTQYTHTVNMYQMVPTMPTVLLQYVDSYRVLQTFLKHFIAIII